MVTLTRIRRAPLPVRVLIGAAPALVFIAFIQVSTASSDSQIQAALAASVGYLGQAAAPYLLVPFAMGATARTRRGAAIGGVLACWSLIAAYYGWFIPGSFAAARGYTVEGAVWLIAAVLAGSICGLLGYGAGRPGWTRLIMPAALILEPIGWLLLLALRVAPVLSSPTSRVSGAIEALIGTIWLAAAIRHLILGRIVRARTPTSIVPAGPLL